MPWLPHDSPFGTDGCRVAESADSSSAVVDRDEDRHACSGMRDATVQPGKSLAQVRQPRVCAIRHQLQQGTYDVDSRLTAVLDRVLRDLAT
jgi:anti-sigma28 factor (negative regulator of flagellin synthesis)